jgi:hypothetical protein
MLVGVLSLSACRTTEARKFEAEVLSLDRKIDAVRAAPNEAKPTLLAELEKAPCEKPVVCELKKVCVDAYRAHLSAVGATQRARVLLAAPDGGPGAAIEAAEQLSLADRDLGTSKTLAARCASEQGELRRKARER